MDPVTVMEAAVRDENEIRYARIKSEKKKGYVRLVTNLGMINLELDCDLCPQTCDNFITHCAEKYYVGSKFHRSIRNFIVSEANGRDEKRSKVNFRSKVVIQLEQVRVADQFGIKHFEMNVIRNYNTVLEACWVWPMQDHIPINRNCNSSSDQTWKNNLCPSILVFLLIDLAKVSMESTQSSEGSLNWNCQTSMRLFVAELSVV